MVQINYFSTSGVSSWVTSLPPRQLCLGQARLRHVQKVLVSQPFLPEAASWEPPGGQGGPSSRPCLPSFSWSGLACSPPTSFPRCSPNRVMTFERGFLRDGAALGGEGQEVSLAGVVWGVPQLNSALATRELGSCQAGKGFSFTFPHLPLSGLVSFPMTRSS